MALISPGLLQLAQMKDSRWLTLEVCREHQRNKCTRTATDCKYAHPPAHVEVQNGRVVCCYDSIKGKCQRKEPPCKYLHPPQHLREQLVQNGRNNLIVKNIQMQLLTQNLAAGGQLIPIAQQSYLSSSSSIQPATSTAAAAAAVNVGQSLQPGGKRQAISDASKCAIQLQYPYVLHQQFTGMPMHANHLAQLHPQLHSHYQPPYHNYPANYHNYPTNYHNYPANYQAGAFMQNSYTGDIFPDAATCATLTWV